MWRLSILVKMNYHEEDEGEEEEARRKKREKIQRIEIKQMQCLKTDPWHDSGTSCARTNRASKFEIAFRCWADGQVFWLPMKINTLCPIRNSNAFRENRYPVRGDKIGSLLAWHSGKELMWVTMRGYRQEASKRCVDHVYDWLTSDKCRSNRTEFGWWHFEMRSFGFSSTAIWMKKP